MRPQQRQRLGVPARRRSGRPVEQLEQPGVGRVGRGAARAGPAASARPRAGRCPGVLPDSTESEAMSRMSSESWKATPTRSPYAVSASTTSRARTAEQGAVASRRSRSATRSCRRPRRGSARPGRRRRRARPVSRIWPATSRAKVCAWIRTASGPRLGDELATPCAKRKSPVRIATWLSQRALADSARRGAVPPRPSRRRGRARRGGSARPRRRPATTSSASGRSPNSAASSTSSGRNRLPPASIRWPDGLATNGSSLRRPRRRSSALDRAPGRRRARAPRPGPAVEAAAQREHRAVGHGSSQ